MNLNKFILIVWSFMAGLTNKWNGIRSAEQLTIREFKDLKSHSADFSNLEFARKIITMMFANLKKRGRPAVNNKEVRNVA